MKLASGDTADVCNGSKAVISHTTLLGLSRINGAYVVRLMGLMGLALLALAFDGCRGQAMDSGDRFASGRWQLQGWMESDQGSTARVPGAIQTDTVDLTAKQAGNPPASVFFSQFYHGEKDWSDVTFHDGNVSGSLRHGQTDVPVSGSYTRDHFRITLRYAASTTAVDQVIEGKLVAPPG